MAKKLTELIQTSAERLSLTSYEIEAEPYVLTSKEEQQAINNAIEAQKSFIRYKYSSKAFKGEIEAKINATDWNKVINREEILKTANSNKNQFLWHEQRRRDEKQRETDERERIFKECNSKYFFYLMHQKCKEIFNKPFESDNENNYLIKVVCFFMGNDERFETELKLERNKGLFLRGISGLGKSFLFELIKNNPLMPVRINSMIKISEEVAEEGSFPLTVKENKITYLDDVGTEQQSVIKHYGTNVNWFKNFIETNYINHTIFKNIVISSNCSFADIEEKYGFRVRSRMKEMFNVINLTGKDRRK